MNYSNDISSQIRTISIFLLILMALLIGCGQNMAAKKAIEICHESKLITEIRISEDSESFNILIKGNRMLTYMSVKQTFPLTVIFYFLDYRFDQCRKSRRWTRWSRSGLMHYFVRRYRDTFNIFLSACDGCNNVGTSRCLSGFSFL